MKSDFITANNLHVHLFLSWMLEDHVSVNKQDHQVLTFDSLWVRPDGQSCYASERSAQANMTDAQHTDTNPGLSNDVRCHPPFK